MEKFEQAPPPPAKLVFVLSVLALAAGASGMVVSFLFLASSNHLDVIAGAAGFIAGSVLAAAGLLSLAIERQSPTFGEAAIRAARCLLGLAPPMTAILSWPLLYFSLFLGALPFLAFVMLLCLCWAWAVSEGVAVNLAALTSWRHVRVVRGVVFFLQVVAILASWPLFACLLRLLESMGYKVGWS